MWYGTHRAPPAPWKSTPDGDVLVARVRDDGPGIKEDGVSGFGLRGMRERARLVGGTAAWRNSPGRGFEVEAQLPLGGSR